MPWYRPERHVCVEPFAPYADRLEQAGYEVLRKTAFDALSSLDLGQFDAVYLLDVIEHMTRPGGGLVLSMAQALGPKQVVVFTPNGFLPQEGDAWGLGGEYWQRHRSGWTPADFPDWKIEPAGVNQFFALWTRA
jgi:hypothetical protein